jgi:hypothetical protein
MLQEADQVRKEIHPGDPKLQGKWKAEYAEHNASSFPAAGLIRQWKGYHWQDSKKWTLVIAP